MANLITHSLSYSKESLTEYILKPLFIQSDIRDIITVRTDIQGSEKLDFISTLSKITKAYAQGSSFTSSTGVVVTQKTLNVVKMKAEVKQAGNAFFGWVKEHALMKGVNWDDITGTVFEEIVSEVFMAGLKADLQRQVFFGDQLKETSVSDATLDADYKEYDGFWTRIIADFKSVAIPAAQRITLANGAVKQVTTTTLTGTSGTSNVTINGTAYLATFATSLTITAANFVTAYAAIIAARHYGHVLTSSGAGLILTAGVEGVAHSMSASVNVSGDLAGNAVATTPNTLPADLGTDEAQTALQDMWKARPAEMKKFKAETKVICTSSFYENYRESLEADGTEAAHIKLVNGVERLTFRGIELIEREEWDVHIADDFAGYYPHRALMTIPKNLVFGTDMADADMMAEEFYDKVEQENIFRVQYKGGTQYIHSNYIVAAF